jgi:hypothetical protein
MNKNINFKSAALGFAASAVAVGTMLGAVTPAHAGPVLCSPSPKPAFSVVENTGYEVNGTLGFQIKLSRPACTSVKVHFATENSNPISAVANGVDYTTTSGDVIIPAKSTSVWVSVPLTLDNEKEVTEHFQVRLTNPVGGTIFDNLAEMAILDGPVVPG